MNKYLVPGALLLAVVIGYGIYSMRNTADTPSGVEEAPSVVTMSGTVTSVDNSQVMLDGPIIIAATDDAGAPFFTAVPSMGLPLCPAFANIADVAQAVAGDTISVSGFRDADEYIVPCDNPEHYLTLTSIERNDQLGFEFSYRKGPDGYVILQDGESTHVDFVNGFMLVNKKDYEAYEQSTEPREGPPAIYVHVYENTETQTAKAWLENNAVEANSARAIAPPEETTVGGNDAMHFVTDGLYPLDTYVIAQGAYIYMLMGAYIDTASPIYEDFQTLVSSFMFVPLQADAAQGKIDVKTACESALAYMTFADGSEADAFVEECIAGEHPEVIDRYIQDLGVDGAAI